MDYNGPDLGHTSGDARESRGGSRGQSMDVNYIIKSPLLEDPLIYSDMDRHLEWLDTLLLGLHLPSGLEVNAAHSYHGTKVLLSPLMLMQDTGLVRSRIWSLVGPEKN